MEIRRIGSSESELVINLFDKYRIFYKKSPDIDLARKYIRDRLENNESVIFVALERQGVEEIAVGFTQLYPTYSSVSAVKNWILNDLYVESDQRKKGIGENLIKAAIAFAKDNGATYVQLETAIDNHTAQSLYETIGFEKQKPEDGYFVYRIDVDWQ